MGRMNDKEVELVSKNKSERDLSEFAMHSHKKSGRWANFAYGFIGGVALVLLGWYLYTHFFQSESKSILVGDQYPYYPVEEAVQPAYKQYGEASTPIRAHAGFLQQIFGRNLPACAKEGNCACTKKEMETWYCKSDNGLNQCEKHEKCEPDGYWVESSDHSSRDCKSDCFHKALAGKLSGRCYDCLKENDVTCEYDCHMNYGHEQNGHNKCSRTECREKVLKHKCGWTPVDKVWEACKHGGF